MRSVAVLSLSNSLPRIYVRRIVLSAIGMFSDRVSRIGTGGTVEGARILLSSFFF